MVRKVNIIDFFIQKSSLPTYPMEEFVEILKQICIYQNTHLNFVLFKADSMTWKLFVYLPFEMR